MVPTVQEAGWTPGLVWTGTENITPTGIWSPDHPARSASLYQLCYTGPHLNWNQTKWQCCCESVCTLITDGKYWMFQYQHIHHSIMCVTGEPAGSTLCSHGRILSSHFTETFTWIAARYALFMLLALIGGMFPISHVTLLVTHVATLQHKMTWKHAASFRDL